jgi:hypothetical protein
MAYITTQEVKNIRNLLKDNFPEFKFSISGGNSSSLKVAIMSGQEDFSSVLGQWTSVDVNQYRLRTYGKYEKLFGRMFEVMKSQNWYDESDITTDYFHTAYYLSLSIGKWDKPYVQVAK